LSRLARTTPERIAGALGEDRVRWARTRDEIEVRIGQGRIGRELFPVLILAVASVLAAEQLLANRFYRESSRAESPESRARKNAPALDS
jgi:hypothetical protein